MARNAHKGLSQTLEPSFQKETYMTCLTLEISYHGAERDKITSWDVDWTGQWPTVSGRNCFQLHAPNTYHMRVPIIARWSLCLNPTGTRDVAYPATIDDWKTVLRLNKLSSKRGRMPPIKWYMGRLLLLDQPWSNGVNIASSIVENVLRKRRQSSKWRLQTR